MIDIDASELKEHIKDMRDKAKGMECEAREMLAIAKSIRAESFTLENRFEDNLFPSKSK